MTAHQAKRLSEERLAEILAAHSKEDVDELFREGSALIHHRHRLELLEHIAALEAAAAARGEQVRELVEAGRALDEIAGLVRHLCGGSWDRQLAAISAAVSLSGELTEACQELLHDQDECYEPDRAIVVLRHLDRVRAALAALAPTEKNDAE